MPPREISRGARRCLDRLRWYARRYGQVHPSQQKLAVGLNVSDRQVRSYLAELRAAGLISVRQGGDGHPASYHLTPARTSELTSGLLPSCFRAESLVDEREPVWYQPVAVKHFRAERPQSRSNCSSGSDQSEYTVQGQQEPAIAATESSLYENAQTEAIADAVRRCGFEPTPALMGKLERKRCYFGVTGFVVAAAITRAFKLVDGSSNAPQTDRWFPTVVENALKSRPAIAMILSDSTKKAPASPSWSTAPDPEHAVMYTQIPDRVASVDQVELSAEDRRCLAELKKVYRFASPENLMEALAESKRMDRRPPCADNLALSPTVTAEPTPLLFHGAMPHIGTVSAHRLPPQRAESFPESACANGPGASR